MNGITLDAGGLVVLARDRFEADGRCEVRVHLLAEADRGEFATDEQIRAAWAKHNL